MIQHYFRLNRAYLTLNDLRIGSCKVDIFKKLWEIHIPPKVSFLMWRIFLYRIPTRMNLQKRHIQLLDHQLKCVLCNEKPEDTSHLFFTCSVSHLIWKRWSLVQVQLSQNLQRITSGNILMTRLGVNTRDCGWWGGSILWNIWLQRNAIIFEGHQLDRERL